MRKTVSVTAMLLLTLAVALVVATPAVAQTNLSGLWDAVVVTNGGEIPFRYEIAVRGNQAAGLLL